MRSAGGSVHEIENDDDDDDDLSTQNPSLLHLDKALMNCMSQGVNNSTIQDLIQKIEQRIESENNDEMSQVTVELNQMWGDAVDEDINAPPMNGVHLTQVLSQSNV